MGIKSIDNYRIIRIILSTIQFQYTECMSDDFLSIYQKMGVKEFASFVKVADRHIVLPSWLVALENVHIPRDMFDHYEKFKSAVVLLNEDRNQNIIAECQTVSSHLSDIGGNIIFIKGCAGVLSSFYPSMETRVIGDIDILLHESAIPAAVGKLNAAGYQFIEKPLSELDNESPLDRHHITPIQTPSRKYLLELHYAFVKGQRNWPNISELLSESVAIPGWGNAGVPTAAGSATLAIAHSALRGEIMGMRKLRPRDMVDFIALTTSGSFCLETLYRQAERAGYGADVRWFIRACELLCGFKTERYAPIKLGFMDTVRAHYQIFVMLHPKMALWLRRLGCFFTNKSVRIRYLRLIRRGLPPGGDPT